MSTQIDAVRRALPPVQEAVQKFQTIEQPLTQAECEQAMTELKALKHGLQAIASDIVGQGDCSDILHNERYYAMRVTLLYSLDQVEEACLQLTSYMPHHKSVARRYLYQRKDVARMFKTVAKAAQELVQAATVPTTNTARSWQVQSQPSRRRPGYLRVVPTIPGEEV